MPISTRTFVATNAVVAILIATQSGCTGGMREDVSSVHRIVRGGRGAPTEGASHELDSDVLEAAPEEWLRQEPEIAELVSDELSVDDALRIALLNNRSLRAEFEALGIARGQLLQASVLPNPDFEAQMRVSEDPDQPPQWDFGIGIDLTHAILMGGRRGVAEAEIEAARIRVAGATLDLALEVRLAFYALVAAQEQLGLMQRATLTLRAASVSAETLHAAGNLTVLDMVSQQASYEQIRIAAAEAEALVIEKREALNVLLGLFGADTSWTAPTRFEVPTGPAMLPDRVESQALTASLELMQMRASLLAASRRVGLSETEGWLPDINLGVHAEYDGQSWELGPSLTGRLPLFDQNLGRTSSLNAEFEVMREQYVASAITLRAAVRSVRARLLSAEARVAHYRDHLLPLRQRVVDETLLQYNAMQIGVFQLLAAVSLQIDAGQGYVRTLHEYWRARAAMEQLLSGRVRGTVGASTPNAPGMGGGAQGVSAGAH